MLTKSLSASTTNRGQGALNRVGAGVEWSGVGTLASPRCWGWLMRLASPYDGTTSYTILTNEKYEATTR